MTRYFADRPFFVLGRENRAVPTVRRVSRPAHPRFFHEYSGANSPLWVLVLARIAAAFVLLPGVPTSAETTKTWDQTTFEHFEKGRAEGVSIRSDGKLMLAPRLRRIHEAPSSYFQALAVDAQGNVYAGAGPEAAVLRITPDGETTTLFETDAVEIRALAAGPDGNLYAASFPDAKVFKIDAEGNAAVFFDPEADYIWDMAFDSDGNLFLACGAKGRIFRVSPSGEGTLYFDTEQTHVRAISVADDGTLVVGTDPGGLILRVAGSSTDASADAEPRGFVLYQTAKKEITALVRAADGTVYASAVGKRKAGAPPPPTPAAPTPTPTAAPGAALMPGNVTAAQQPTPRLATANVKTKITGGSEVYRIRPDGQPEVVWSSDKDIVYALGLDADGKLLIGSGDRGRLLRLDSKTAWSLVLSTPSKQITALAAGPNGRLFAATGNIGAVYELGPGPAAEGTFTSEPFDANIFSEWGRIQWRGTGAGSNGIALSTRGGNLRGTARNWSDWSPAVTDSDGGPAGSPASRFVQWRATLKPAAESDSPLLESVRLYYLPKNIAPKFTHLQMVGPNLRFVTAAKPNVVRNRNLPPLGAKPPAKPPVRPTKPNIVTREIGRIGARWAVVDPNQDKLTYRLEIRGESESEWKVLEDDFEIAYHSWDSTAFADGLYRVRVTVSDRLSNPLGQAETDTRASEPFLIDNSAPTLSNVAAERIETRLRVRLDAADTATKIRKAEYSIDGGEWTPVAPTTRLFDSGNLSFDFETADVDSSEHTVAVRVADSRGNVAAAKAVVRRPETADGR